MALKRCRLELGTGVDLTAYSTNDLKLMLAYMREVDVDKDEVIDKTLKH